MSLVKHFPFLALKRDYENNHAGTYEKIFLYAADFKCVIMVNFALFLYFTLGKQPASKYFTFVHEKECSCH